MGRGSREVTPSHSLGKTAISGSGASIGRLVEQQCLYEKIARARYEDKQTSRYERYTTKEKVSSSERHVERGKRQVGVRDEFKKSSTVKIGDKSGYTEYKVKERIRNVDFGRGGTINGPNNHASNNIGDSFDDADDNDDYESGHHDDDFAPNGDYGDDDADQFDDCYGGCSDDCDDDVADPSNDCGDDVGDGNTPLPMTLTAAAAMTLWMTLKTLAMTLVMMMQPQAMTLMMVAAMTMAMTTQPLVMIVMVATTLMIIIV